MKRRHTGARTGGNGGKKEEGKGNWLNSKSPWNAQSRTHKPMTLKTSTKWWKKNRREKLKINISSAAHTSDVRTGSVCVCVCVWFIVSSESFIIFRHLRVDWKRSLCMATSQPIKFEPKCKHNQSNERNRVSARWRRRWRWWRRFCWCTVHTAKCTHTEHLKTPFFDEVRRARCAAHFIFTLPCITCVESVCACLRNIEYPRSVKEIRCIDFWLSQTDTRHPSARALPFKQAHRKSTSNSHCFSIIPID